MRVKWFIFKGWLTVVLLCILWGQGDGLRAQERDTVYIVQRDTLWLESLSDASQEDAVMQVKVRSNKYDKRVHRYRKHWEVLIPTHIKLQYAGNMGLISLGTGWDYGRRNQWETDILFGFLPRYKSSENKVTFTLKQNYIPWSLQIKEGPFSVEPLTCGLYINTVLADEFWVSEPDRYPKGYYGFSSKIRFNIFLGQRLTFDIPQKRRFLAKQVTVFYEVSTSDLYIVSAFTNSYLKPKDYLSLSFGLKFQLL